MRLPPDAIKLNDPIIVVDVLSPSSLALASGAKLAGYCRLPSVRHYAATAAQISHPLLDPPGVSRSECSRGRDNDLRRVGALR